LYDKTAIFFLDVIFSHVLEGNYQKHREVITE